MSQLRNDIYIFYKNSAVRNTTILYENGQLVKNVGRKYLKAPLNQLRKPIRFKYYGN